MKASATRRGAQNGAQLGRKHRFVGQRQAQLSAAERIGRDPAEIERSACVLVVLDRGLGERPIPEDCPPLEGSADRIAEGLRAMAEAGAHEAILVVSPITERSIRELGATLAALDA